MDRYPYLEYTILLDERTLARLGNLHFLLHIFKNTIMQMPIKFLVPLSGKSFYLIVVFMLISTLSTSLVLQTFVLI